MTSRKSLIRALVLVAGIALATIGAWHFRHGASWNLLFEPERLRRPYASAPMHLFWIEFGVVTALFLAGVILVWLALRPSRRER